MKIAIVNCARDFANVHPFRSVNVISVKSAEDALTKAANVNYARGIANVSVNVRCAYTAATVLIKTVIAGFVPEFVCA